jgi:hypothetical protein
MFAKTASVLDWRDLQKKVARIFREMGYEVEIEKEVALAGRGKKEIDVYVTDPSASYNRVYLIECKLWVASIPQDVVHSFKTVMEETGANTGFIISKKEPQRGAREAARYTNIQLLDFENLQHIYGNEWFRKQRTKLELQLDRLNRIRHTHFDQFDPACIHNNAFFHTSELQERLSYFNVWSARLLAGGYSRWPESYLGPEPVKMAGDPWEPLAETEGWYEFATVRDYFRDMINATRRCADDFEKTFAEAQRSFEDLPDKQHNEVHERVLRRMLEDSPVRVLKRHLSTHEYEALLARLRPN